MFYSEFQVRKTDSDATTDQLRTLKVHLLRGHAKQDQVHYEEEQERPISWVLTAAATHKLSRSI